MNQAKVESQCSLKNRLSSRSGTRRREQEGTGIIKVRKWSTLQKPTKYENTVNKRDKIIYIGLFLIISNFLNIFYL